MVQMFEFKCRVWGGQGQGTIRCCSGEMEDTGPPRKLGGTFEALQNIQTASGRSLLPPATPDTPHTSNLQTSAHAALPARNIFHFWPIFPPGTQGQLILGTRSNICSHHQTLFPDFPNQSYLCSCESSHTECTRRALTGVTLAISSRLQSCG